MVGNSQEKETQTALTGARTYASCSSQPQSADVSEHFVFVSIEYEKVIDVRDYEVYVSYTVKRFTVDRFHYGSIYFTDNSLIRKKTKKFTVAL